MLVEAAPFSVKHFEEWAKGLELDDGNAWVVEPFFLRFVEDVFAGFQQAWLVVPEGNAKTTGLAGLALYHCEFRRNAYVPWAASARDQAQIGYTQAKVFAMSMPVGRRPRCYDGYRRITFANGSQIQVFAAGSEHADGVIPTLPIIDELHRNRTLALYRTWAGKLRKRGGQLLTISTAGEPGSEFEETRAKIIADAADVTLDGGLLRAASARTVLHEYAVRGGDPHDMVAVKLANPFSKITVESLAEKLDDPTMTENHWLRFTCNVAAADEGRELFIDPADWARLGDGDFIDPSALADHVFERDTQTTIELDDNHIGTTDVDPAEHREPDQRRLDDRGNISPTAYQPPRDLCTARGIPAPPPDQPHRHLIGEAA